MGGFEVMNIEILSSRKFNASDLKPSTARRALCDIDFPPVSFSDTFDDTQPEACSFGTGRVAHAQYVSTVGFGNAGALTSSSAFTQRRRSINSDPF